MSLFSRFARSMESESRVCHMTKLCSPLRTKLLLLEAVRFCNGVGETRAPWSRCAGIAPLPLATADAVSPYFRIVESRDAIVKSTILFDY